MKRMFLGLLFITLLLNCKSKKTSLQEEDEIEVADFINFFPERTLPIRVADTTLTHKTSDSSLITFKIFTKFIPDSIFSKDFGKGVKPKLYPLGRTREKGKEIYLFFKAVSGNRRIGYLACFTKEEIFMNALPLVKTGAESYTETYGMLDNKFQITTYREKKNGSSLQFKRNVYVINNSSNDFTLVMTEPNEEIIEQIFNPIDTLKQTNKLSGNYVKDKRNFISVRDAKKNGELLFFIHFEKDNGECIGELKGMLRLVSKNMANYQEPGNPCSLEVEFGTNSITIKETGGCGSFRNIKCFFEGTYPKKNLPKPRPVSKKNIAKPG